MEQWEVPMCGTTKISNPKTLQRWFDLGWYQEKLDEGYTFNPYCGRFSIGVCECGKCRNKTPNRDELIRTLNINTLNLIKWNRMKSMTSRFTTSLTSAHQKKL